MNSNPFIGLFANMYFTCFAICYLYRPLGYKRVYLTLREMADTPFHIQRDDMYLFY